MKTKENLFDMALTQGTLKKFRDETWDFRTANTKLYTHCFHTYPAMMIPQVAERILDEFGRNAKLLFDPYCGTGTSLVSANIKGINAIGTDINPLARLIAKAKTTIIPIETLDERIRDFHDFIFSVQWGKRKVKPHIPNFMNIDYWFKKETQYQLAVIKEYIDQISTIDVQNFFKVGFSETIREVSLTKNSEFKLVRMSPHQIEKFNPDVFSIMLSKLKRNRDGMSQFIKAKRSDAVSKVYDFDSVYGIPEDILPEGSVDIVLTSPPYGDSRTTVAYGQFSRLSNQWLGLEEFNEVDKRSMGGTRKKEIKSFDFKPLDELISKIGEIDEGRMYDVLSFYIDYERSISNVANVVRMGGIVAYVVGNRKVKGIEIPNDEITREFFERNGFTHICTIIREIPNKRMPKRNSPTNISGKTDTTMHYEYIVVLRKTKSK
jgi:DNA modification methylase